MRFKLLAGVCLVLCAMASASAQQQFMVYARLTDSSGAAATKAAPENFRVLEDGVQAKITKVEAVNWPLKLQVLIDNGTGMGTENIGVLRNSLRTLIEAVPADAEVTLVTTSPQPRFLVRATKDRKALLQGIDRLSPDYGAGRFIASLAEALGRVERDKSDHSPVILTIGTTAGDAAPNQSDVSDASRRLQQLRQVKVHVVMVAVQGFTAGGGGNQIEVGINAAKMTGGKYENINSPNTLGTVLTAIAGEIAKSSGSDSGRFRLTAERPSGKTGDLGKIGVASLGGLIASDVTVEMK